MNKYNMKVEDAIKWLRERTWTAYTCETVECIISELNYWKDRALDVEPTKVADPVWGEINQKMEEMGFTPSEDDTLTHMKALVRRLNEDCANWKKIALEISGDPGIRAWNEEEEASALLEQRAWESMVTCGEVENEGWSDSYFECKARQAFQIAETFTRIAAETKRVSAAD